MRNVYWLAGPALAAAALVGAASIGWGGTDLAKAVAQVAENATKLDPPNSDAVKAPDAAAPKQDQPLIAPPAAPTGQKGARGQEGQAAVTVETANARAASTTADMRAVGTLLSDESVQIASEIAGRIAEITFKEGTEVKENDVLLKLDDVLAKAELADADARFELAKSNLDRARTLSRSGNVTDKARDEAVATFETGNAGRELARARLEKHTIRAPFPGVIGTRRISVGAFVGVGASLVNLEKIDTLKVDFKTPERYLAAVAVGQQIEVTVDALPGQMFSGEIYSIDPLVDVNGRSLQVRARLANPGMKLRPGLFARVLIKGQIARSVVLVPESAVVPRGGETFVFTVANGKATEAKVKLGERKSAEVEILEGIEPETMVVTAGQQRLRNGSSVEVLASTGSTQPRVKRGS